jgi:hypothetical protein
MHVFEGTVRACSSVLVERSCVRLRRPAAAASSSSKLSNLYTIPLFITSSPLFP